MGKSIYEQEEKLHEDLKSSYPADQRGKIVDDGLCWKCISNKKPEASSQNWPENLWVNSKRRVLFFLKESNGNDGEDYKDWDWSHRQRNTMFGDVLAYWLEGILLTNKETYPSYKNLSCREIFYKHPLAIVNVKKEAGDNAAEWGEIWEHAQKNKEILKKQIREILKPNIIVCCGSNDTGNDNTKMLTIAKEIIFEDEKNNFCKIKNNNWCYYNKKLDILLIDSYHPTYFKKNYSDKIDGLLKGFHEFIKEVNYKN